MSADFLKVKLADLCTDVSYGYTASSISESVGPKFLRITDIQGGTVDWASVPYCEASESAKRKNKLERGDIVIARTGNSTGENYIFESNEDTVFASYLIRFRVNPALANPYFVWLQLRTQAWWDYVSGSKSGSAQAGANAKVLGCYELNLPGREVQNKIELIFRKLNEKIQVNLQINQTLEQMAQAIFKSWFVDFEPVKAKIAALEAGGSEDDALLAAMQAIAGSALFATDAADADAQTQLARLQTEHPEQYTTLRATAELFPSAMQESELGEIPEGWSVAALADFGDVVCGKTPSKQKAEYYGSEVPFIKIPDMHGNIFVTKANEYLSSEGAASQPKKSIPKGSVCVSCIATVGLVVIAIEDSHTNQQINSIVPKKHVYTPYLYFRMQSLNKHLHDLASGGSATLNLNTSNFSKIQIIKPAEAVLEKYHEVTAQLLNKILEGSLENQTLSELRDTLLPKLLSGELSVAEAE